MRILFLILLFSALPYAIFAQNETLHFEHLTVDDGLSQNTIYCILLDSKGFLWFGTQDGGINKYDGYTIKIYDQNPILKTSISSNSISDICEDRSGMIWIGTWGGGLSMFNPKTETFTNYLHDPSDSSSLSNNRAQTLYIDHLGGLWIGTAGGGLNKFDKKTNSFIHFQHNPDNIHSISNNRVWDIIQDDENNYWIATGNGLNLFYHETGKFMQYLTNKHAPNGISNSEIRTLYIDTKGILWAGTSWGLNKFDKKNNWFKSYIPYPNDPPKLYTNKINCIFEHSNGNLWLGTHKGGLCLFNPKTEKFVIHRHNDEDPNSLIYDDIRDICIDNSDNLWIATRGGGVDKIDLKPRKFNHTFRNPKSENTLSNNRVKAFVVDNDSIIWIATNGGGLNKYNSKTGLFKHYLSSTNCSNCLGSNHIRTIINGPDETLWLGTNGGGLSMMNKKTGEFKTFIHNPADNNSISDNDVMALCFDATGHLWVGTSDGLNKINIETGKNIVFKNDPRIASSVSDNRIYSLLIDFNGAVWIGTDNGLNKYIPSTNSFNKYQNIPGDTTSISNNDIYSLYNDVFGNLWIGTGRGLNKFDLRREMFVSYNKSEELAGTAIMGIVDDNHGNLWISSIKGLSKLDFKNNKFRNYDDQDGLQSKEFLISSCSKGLSGELYFGGINGFNSFHPDSIADNSYIPPVVITNFELFYKKVYHHNNKNIQKDITYCSEIELSYKENIFSFEFSALNYTKPEKNQYACYLEGFDNNWNYLGIRRYVTYTNIPPGKYVLHIKASNNDGVWNEEGTSLTITIRPPFWRTWAFIILMGIVGVILLYLLIKARERRLKYEKKILENKVLLRTTELKQKQEEIIAQAEELEKLSIVAQETDSAVIIANGNGEIEWINEGYTRLIGYTYDELIEKQGLEIIDDNSSSEAKRAYRRCLEQKVSVVYSYRTFTKNDCEIWLQSTITPILDSNDEITKFISLQIDITKIKIAEEEIEEQRNEIEYQRDRIVERNREIRDSIHYARRIQRALLPPESQINATLNEYFIFNKPRDIVSGDFYWAGKKGYKIIVAVADCTGHGVPGAFMSMLGLAFMNDIINSLTQIHANIILNELRAKVITALHQMGTSGEVLDGMDLALCVLDFENMSLEFSGAFNPLFIIRDKKLIELEADKMPISMHTNYTQPFKYIVEEIQKGDMLYLFSDGYADQFGGKKGRKFMIYRLRQLLLDISHLPCETQNSKLMTEFETWKGNEDQVDDILVFGIRI